MTGAAQLPPYVTHSNIGFLLVELAWVVLLLAGMTAAWRWVRPLPVWRGAAEALLAVPVLLALPLLGLAALGVYRPANTIVQVALVVLGALALIRGRDAVRGAPSKLIRDVRADPLFGLALAAVALFALWSWAVPFPEAFNGHHHILFNQVNEIWRSGEFAFLDLDAVSYDNNILTYPQHLTMLLGLFSVQGIDSVDLRPVFFLAPAGALFVLLALRATCERLGSRAAGSGAFLLVAFSYWTAADFTQISYDLLTPLAVALFGYAVVDAWSGHRPDVVGVLVPLGYAAAIRPPVAVMLGVVAVLAVAVRPRLVRHAGQAIRPASRVLPLAALLVAPAAGWLVLMKLQYDSFSFPHGYSATNAVENRADYGAFNVQGSEEGESGFLAEHLFPVDLDSPAVMVKEALSGFSFSLLATTAIAVALLVGLIPAVRRRAPELGSLRVLTLVYIAGAAAVGFALFEAYPKYPHYAAMLVAPLPAVSAALLLRGNTLRAAVATGAAVWVAGMGFFALTTWGHANEDRSLRNVRYLLPTSGTPVDRLARRANRPVADIRGELTEYEAALDALRPGERILLADHEPGALVPSLVDREYLGDAPWLDGAAGRPLRQARNDAELRSAIARGRIRFAFRPGRQHLRDDGVSIYERLRSYAGPERYVVPADRLP